AFGSSLQRGVDFFRRYILGNFQAGVDHAAVRYRNAHREAFDLALQFRNDFADRFAHARGGGDDVDGGGASAAQIAVNHVGDALVVGVGVNGGNHALHNAEAIVDDLDHWRGAVRGAAGVGQAEAFLLQGRVVDAEYDGLIDAVFGRG